MTVCKLLAPDRYELEDDTMEWDRATWDDGDLVPTEQLPGLRRDPLINVDDFADPGRTI